MQAELANHRVDRTDAGHAKRYAQENHQYGLLLNHYNFKGVLTYEIDNT
jgi:hypothetical protein